MIGSIKGTIILQKDKFILVETNGVGYKINISTDTISNFQKNKDIFLWIHTHIREDSFDLYGFINVSGIGPKGALSILNANSIENLKKAIGSNDTSYLIKISGIGRKTAEKMIIELRDKIGKELNSESLQEELDVLEALKSLGYSQNETREILKKIDPRLDTNKKIKEALKILGGKQSN